MKKFRLSRVVSLAVLCLGVWDSSLCSGQDHLEDQGVVEQMGQSLQTGSFRGQGHDRRRYGTLAQ